MKATLLGYDYVEYSKNGEDRSFVSVFVTTPKEITFGTECKHVICSRKYFMETIMPAFEHGSEVHVGFDKKKNNQPFLYLKK